MFFRVLTMRGWEGPKRTAILYRIQPIIQRRNRPDKIEKKMDVTRMKVALA